MTLDELLSLARHWEDCTLPKDRWPHQSHLCVAVWSLTQWPRGEATDRIREGIQQYNASLGDSQRYHETITLSWNALLDNFLSSAGQNCSPAELAAAAAERFADSAYFLRHFSRERLYSETARRIFLQPDISPLH